MSQAAQGNFANITGVAVEQIISARSSILYRIVASNTDVAAQTILVENGATDEIITITLQPNENGTFEFNCECPLGIRITPSDAQLDIAVVYSER